ncbi:molybdopterin cofactor-binding domain-containing protein [Novosphingobium bradum]|uniref:Molybdopterin cofactor-binding domain-containing protein n=1 Tax=Novosphingobium bradum TaxID=1737444 RepID=A0ABV7ILU7_9SPHN
MRLTRRGLLIGGAAGGGLLVAWALTPRHFPQELPLKDGEFAFGAWLAIARTGIVTVAVPQLEMGQGVSTLLAQVVAMELGADWRKVAAVPAPISGAYANAVLAADWAPLWMPLASGLAEGEDSRMARGFAERERFMATAGGTSLAAYEGPARLAAAAARELLCRAAAARWDVAWTECKAAGGFVSHGNRRAGFGDLAEDAAGHDLPGDPALGPAPAEPAAGTGTAFPRIDLPALAEGSARFAGDIRLEGMVFAAIRHAPVGQAAALGTVDESRAGGVRLVHGSDWLAAVGPTWWAADQALARVAPAFKVSRPVDTSRIEAALDQAVKKARTERIATLGDPEGAMGEGPPSLIARYDIAPALHATLETASCTARLEGGRLELWLATQSPETSRRAAARALGLNPRDVVLYPMPAGGSFDARLDTPHAVEAALIAREVGKPVQLVWSRWQEQVAGKPRPPAAAVLWARTRESAQGQGGEVISWHTRIATPAAAREFGRRLFGGEAPAAALAASAGEADPLALSGAVPPYGLAHFALDHVPVVTGIPAGRMRGNGHAMTAFFTESFVDELARAAGREPLSYRIAMLGGDLRLAECLQQCATLAGWDAGADASGQGLACHRLGPAHDPEGTRAGRIAVIATARQDAAGVRVEKITAVADIGRIVNRDLARQQIEGGLVFGLGLTLGASTSWARGLPVAERLSQLSLPVLGNTPEIVVAFVESTAPPVDPGELGVVAVAPAIANALHSATGVRFRKLPLFAEEV